MQPVIDEIYILLNQEGFSYITKDLGYGIRRTFENKMRFDLIDYKKKGSIVLRVGRGAWLVKKYPILHGLFDEVAKVIAKVRILSPQTLHDKHLVGVFRLLAQAPDNIGVF